MTNGAGIIPDLLGTALMKPFHYLISAIGPRKIGTHSPGFAKQVSFP